MQGALQVLAFQLFAVGFMLLPSTTRSIAAYLEFASSKAYAVALQDMDEQGMLSSLGVQRIPWETAVMCDLQVPPCSHVQCMNLPACHTMVWHGVLVWKSYPGARSLQACHQCIYVWHAGIQAFSRCLACCTCRRAALSRRHCLCSALRLRSTALPI